LLAPAKRLRGTAFDLFGYTAERRMERGLIDWYEDVIAMLLPLLDADRLPDLVRIASAPMDIRGFGPVKQEAVEKVKAEMADWIAKTRDRPAGQEAARANKNPKRMAKPEKTG
jgi:indolepyruvate ferredoxin oxidoreductase